MNKMSNNGMNQISNNGMNQMSNNGMNQMSNNGMNNPFSNKNIKNQFTQNIYQNGDNMDGFQMDDALVNLYQDNNIQSLDTYNEDNDNIDPMTLYEKYNNQRTEEDSTYKSMRQDNVDFENSQENMNNQVDMINQKVVNKRNQEDSIFQDSLTFKMNQKMNSMDVNTIKSQLDNSISTQNPPKNLTNPPTAEDLPIVNDNSINDMNPFFEMLKKKLFEDRNYINRENLIIINSGDRDWFNDGNENRYSFQVRFKPERTRVETVSTRNQDGTISYENKTFYGEEGCGLENEYKNIIAFEMIRVLMPIENFIIPFDNRIFIDYKSLPYIILKIDEFQGLYSGTNHLTNNAFSKLLFDKDHTNEVVQLTSSDVNSGKSYFSRQIKRGYSSMASMSNEKKTFYPSPLSSLNRLTISLTTPYGENIYNHNDVLQLSSVTVVDCSALTLELSDAHGLPYNNEDKVIEITTTYFFNNRVFKIGDNIRFKNFTPSTRALSETNNVNWIEFMNRETGHYIINLEKETSAVDTSTNKGYIQKLYIAPPGSINYAETTSTYIAINTTSLDTAATNLHDTSATCKFINQSIQTHYVFKITTREDDMSKVMNSANI